MNQKILLLFSNSQIGDKIEDAFLDAGFEVERTDNHSEAVKSLNNENPQAMVVDWDFANGALKDINRLINKRCQKTALVLFSRNKDTEERIRALKDGADECLSQPTEVQELIAKVNALMRRIDVVNRTPQKIKIKDIEINLDTHEVRKRGKLIDLTYTQFKILYLLASQRESVFSRDEIIYKVWGKDACLTDRNVDVHVKRLREKLGGRKRMSRYIQTIHGIGYQVA